MTTHAPSAVPGRCVVCRNRTHVRRVCLGCLPTKPHGERPRFLDGPLIIIAAPGTRPGENPIDAIVRMHEEETA